MQKTVRIFFDAHISFALVASTGKRRHESCCGNNALLGLGVDIDTPNEYTVSLSIEVFRAGIE